MLSPFVVQRDMRAAKHGDEVGQPELGVPLGIPLLHRRIDMMEHEYIPGLPGFTLELFYQIWINLPKQLEGFV